MEPFILWPFRDQDQAWQFVCCGLFLMLIGWLNSAVGVEAGKLLMILGDVLALFGIGTIIIKIFAGTYRWR